MEKKKKILVITGIAFFVVGLLVVSFLLFNQRLGASRQVVNHERNRYSDVASQGNIIAEEILSPEQVFEAFRLAISQDDVEAALKYVKNEKKDIYRGIYSQKESLGFYKNISDYTFLQKNENDSTADRTVYYYFINGDLSMPYYLLMTKNVDGKWEIDSI